MIGSDTLPNALFSASSATTTQILPAVSGVRYKVWQFEMQNKHATTDTDVTFKSNTTAISPAYTIYAKGSWGRPSGTASYFVTNRGEALQITTSAAGTLVGQVWYDTD
jgi:hypothetical protein